MYPFFEQRVEQKGNSNTLILIPTFVHFIFFSKQSQIRLSITGQLEPPDLNKCPSLLPSLLSLIATDVRI